MNERIKELAEKVGSTHKQNLGVYQFYPDELQKFAQGLVLKVFDSIQDNGYEIYEPVMDEVLREFGVMSLEDEDE